ncbi:MAG: hypothetical protein ACYSOO_01470 [Planctomycetota bacterium]|jgi:hypothetical protein
MKPEDVKFEGHEPTLTEEELLAPASIDQLVTLEINTTLNTIKIFLGMMVLLREDYREGDLAGVIKKVLGMAPVMEQVLKRSIAGFQEMGETHQTMQLVISEMQQEDLMSQAGVDRILKTISKESGNA